MAYAQFENSTILDAVRGMATSREADLSTLYKTLSKPQYSALREVLSTQQDIVLLAPGNQAFRNLGDFDSRLEQSILSYHIVTKEESTEVIGGKKISLLSTYLRADGVSPVVKMANGTSQVLFKSYEQVDGSEAIVYLYGIERKAYVIQSFKCSNGLLQIVDRVLLPPVSASVTAAQLQLNTQSNMWNRFQIAEKVNTGEDLTLILASDEAWKNFVSGENRTNEEIMQVLLYQICSGIKYALAMKEDEGIDLQTATSKPMRAYKSGGILYLNGQPVIIQDSLTNSGVIHVVDSVVEFSSYEAAKKKEQDSDSDDGKDSKNSGPQAAMESSALLDKGFTALAIFAGILACLAM